ncbi:MAG: GDP-mannose 4,6-dehydratase [Gemmatimonadota bacterium]|nr:GDP-mannose 4,6-dehydratase [Gemmatimonadota bacterium]MDE3216007.1 GDP-mannose 4,6-dehydratase [Gemmatimonadota bacterium]
MSARALITGGGGFVGQWIGRALLAGGWEVYAAGVGAPGLRVLSAEDHRAIRWLTMDIRMRRDVAAALEESRPDAVVHLAGISYLPSAADAPAEAWSVNVVGAVTLLAEVARRRQVGALDPRILVVGSAQQYGRHDAAELPLRETAEQRPLTVYAASKAAQEVAALQAFRADGLRVVATRSFNHSGVGHDEHFLLPALVRRALAIRRGARDTIHIGNGDTIRDYLHVADVVDAYLALLDRGVAGEAYNVCSGEGVRVRDLTDRVLDRVGVSADVQSDPSLQRAADVPALVGSPEKLIQATGWRPRHSRDDIIDDLLHAATL